MLGQLLYIHKGIDRQGDNKHGLTGWSWHHIDLNNNYYKHEIMPWSIFFNYTGW